MELTSNEEIALLNGFMFGLELYRYCQDRAESRGDPFPCVIADIPDVLREIIEGDTALVEGDTEMRRAYKDALFFHDDEQIEGLISNGRKKQRKNKELARVVLKYFAGR